MALQALEGKFDAMKEQVAAVHVPPAPVHLARVFLLSFGPPINIGG